LNDKKIPFRKSIKSIDLSSKLDFDAVLIQELE
jgi:hypothetical protein